MPNPSQPTISLGATGDAVRWLQRPCAEPPTLALLSMAYLDQRLTPPSKSSSKGLV